jgi:hypothetical protein
LLSLSLSLLFFSKAEQWDLANPLQTCGFQVERRDNDLYLLFTTENHTKLFALAKLGDMSSSGGSGGTNKGIEGVVDSSRYFVTQIQNQGRSVYVGFGFRDRDVALDLLGNLQQFQKSIQREQQAKSMKVAEIPKLAQGEKMHISFGKIGSSGDGLEKKTRSSATSGSGGGVGPILLKKPPKVEVTPSGTINKVVDGEEEQVRLNLENVNLQEDHRSVASSASDGAHAANDGDLDDDDDDDDDVVAAGDDEEEWDDFQQAG